MMSIVMNSGCIVRLIWIAFILVVAVLPIKVEIKAILALFGLVWVVWFSSKRPGDQDEGGPGAG
jgi:hypothetical protein